MDVKRFPYGGQAVLEGVMMRGLKQATVAVRNAKGQIVFKHEPLNVKRRHTWETLPFLRGILMLWDALNLGTRSLNFSANVAIQDEEEREAAARIVDTQPVSAAAPETNGQHALAPSEAVPTPKEKTSSDGMMTLTLIVSLMFGIGLFFLLPAVLASVAEGFGAPVRLREAIEGVIQLVIFIGYLYAIGRMPDIQRVFGYHGAEHKTISAYEAGAPLTVDSVRGFTVIHPRCGTSFLLVVVVLSIPIFSLFSELPLWARLLVRIPLIPVIAGISYELLRLSAANYHRRWVRRLVAPSMALQQLTTREPDDEMIAVAIAALLPVLKADGVTPDVFDETLALGVPAAVPLST